ncbi:SDR family oxidoreductase [Dyadobacter sp. CY345]|uniref:SDR family oxidoreductase n=1 Tax=Dyadobacter sp. CY345 TaxID=2909335 RepID=UPI001F1E98DB|nr:SDR family oxidoreductase [Dyadobacter sp. CY345]MCF2443598.1 SDR family oxidoreductase [Dyadobacter sp. CY345]
MSAKPSPKILITGATGNIGKELTKLLSENGIKLRALVRSVDQAKELARLPGAELVEGDFNDPISLGNALLGIEKAFLLTNSSELAEKQQSSFVEVAKSTGLKHIVKLSQWAADLESPVRFLRYHAVVEKLIKESGIAYTFLRPNLFMQGLLGFQDTIINKGEFYGAIGDSRISLIDIRDIAAVAMETLTISGHEEKIYNLTGPESLTHTELAEKLSNKTGRTVKFIDITPEMLIDTLLQVGFPKWQAEGLVEDYAHYKAGEASQIRSGVMEAIGKEPRNFDQFAEDYARYFVPDVRKTTPIF